MKCNTFGTSTAKKLKGAIRYFTSCYYLLVLLNTKELKNSTEDLGILCDFHPTSHNSDLGMKELLPLSG